MDCIHRLPLDRWDLDRAEQLQGDALTLSAQFGACMADVDLFDASAFGLPATEAAAMDPQHRQEHAGGSAPRNRQHRMARGPCLPACSA